MCLCTQEEALLCSTVAAAVSLLLLNLVHESKQDYTYACFFLICTASILRVR